MSCYKKDLFNPFLANVPILYPLKTLGTLARNELRKQKNNPLTNSIPYNIINLYQN